mmetsp:Transcript_21451/g.53181  ORF Transcript_21451/g.53181 Transcript_21451/m.53181 type:complete len:218 (+) Transcript_21451:639-1292(+)
MFRNGFGKCQTKATSTTGLQLVRIELCSRVKDRLELSLGHSNSGIDHVDDDPSAHGKADEGIIRQSEFSNVSVFGVGRSGNCISQRHPDGYTSVLGELDGIAQKVSKNLLHSCLISDEFLILNVERKRFCSCFGNGRFRSLRLEQTRKIELQICSILRSHHLELACSFLDDFPNGKDFQIQFENAHLNFIDIQKIVQDAHCNFCIVGDFSRQNRPPG